MKKLLNSDWLRAVQFKCNTSAKSVTPVQKVKHQFKLHIVILNYDWLKDNRQFSKTMILCKMMTKVLKKVFPNEKTWLQEKSSDTSSSKFFHVYIINK